MRLRTRYLDRKATRLDEALASSKRKRGSGRFGRLARQRGGRVAQEIVRRGVTPDVVTDQTSAHDPLNGYLPQGWTLAEWRERAKTDPEGVMRAAKESMANHVRAMLECRSAARLRSTTATTSGRWRRKRASPMPSTFRASCPAYIRPLFCEGIGPFRWVALSGDPTDIHRTDAKVKELIPDHPHLHRWLDMARERIAFQGLPARICWVGPAGSRPRRAGVQRDGRAGRTEGAGRHRPRSLRFRFGRQPEPRDRGDGGRL